MWAQVQDARAVGLGLRTEVVQKPKTQTQHPIVFPSVAQMRATFNSGLARGPSRAGIGVPSLV